MEKDCLDLISDVQGFLNDVIGVSNEDLLNLANSSFLPHNP